MNATRHLRTSPMAALLAALALCALPARAADTPAPPAAADTPAATVAAQLAHPALALLDVRTAGEYAAGHVPGAINIPVQDLEARLGEIASLKGKPVVVYCHSGRRAATALQLLLAHGYAQATHLAGDMQGWQADGRPVEATPPGH